MPTTAADNPVPPSLHPAAFERCMAALGPFEPKPRLAVGVSGGSDSMALARLADDWARARGGSVTGLIVDHGLREGSAQEAQATRARLAGHGIPAQVLRWTGDKPTTRIQEMARRARLALLEQACAHLGILHLLLAHHADDQAETVAMRREKASGIAGLAGIPAIRETASVRILRPLLATRKADLRRHLRALGEEWVEDPSNTDPRFWRGRHRLLASGSDGEGMASIHPAAEARTAAEWRRARFLARHATLHPLGHLHLDAPAFDGLEPAFRADLLRAVVRSIGGSDFPPRRAACEESVERLDRSAPCSVTLGGTRIRRAGSRLAFMRDPGRIRARLALPAGTAGVWDGRWLVRAPDGRPIRVDRATRDDIDWARTAGADPGRPPLVPQAALLALPALRDENGNLLALGAFCLEPTRPNAGAGTWLRPIHALAGATFGMPPVASTNN